MLIIKAHLFLEVWMALIFTREVYIYFRKALWTALIGKVEFDTGEKKIL